MPPSRPTLRTGAWPRVGGLAAVVLSLAVLPVRPAAAVSTPRMLLLDGAVTESAVIAVGERGTILRSTDQAQSWESAAAPTHATLTGVSFADDGRRGWAVGHDAVILATSDGGSTWTRQYQGDNQQDSLLDVLAVDADHVIAVGAYGLCLATADGGRTWQRRSFQAGDLHLNRITRGPGGTLYLAGESGTLLRSRDRGATWEPIAAPYEGSFYGILALDARTLLAHGLRGHLFRSEDDGETWKAVAVPAPMMLATAIMIRRDLIVLGGQARALFVSRDGGKSVAPASGAPRTAVAELIPLANGRILALGEDGATVLDRNATDGRTP